MFGKSFKLFTMFGFTVKIDLSWLVILVLVVWSLGWVVFPTQYPGLEWWAYGAMGLAGAFGLFLSIVLHELSHSLVARRFGMQMKGITLFMFGGVAEMGDEPPSPKAEFTMAIAGPACSLVLGVAFFALAWTLNAVALAPTAATVVAWLGLINIVLVVFNLIPGFPLDGGRVLRSILWGWKHDLRRATQIASRVGSGFGIFLIAIGFFSLLAGNPIGGLWWILIGMFIRAAARQGYQQVVMRQALHGEPVSRFMNAEPITVDPSLSVQQLVEDYVYKHHFKMYPVVREGHLEGCVSTREISQVPRDEWDRRTVAEIIHQCDADITIRPHEDSMDAMARMNRINASRLLVVEGEQLRGIIALRDLMRFLSAKLELEGSDKSLPFRQAS